MIKLKNKISNAFYIVLCLCVLSSCDSSCGTSNKKDSKYPYLMMQTEHCRYYCVDGYRKGACKIVTCECDKGYSADASISW